MPMSGAARSGSTSGWRVRAGVRCPEDRPSGSAATATSAISGPVASTDGKLAIQVRDLDQTVIGNPAHDMIRLGLSLAMAARGSDLPGVTTAHMLERMVDGYEAAFAPEAQGETLDSEASMPKTVRRVMRSAAGRSWKHLADERIEGVEPVIPLGKRFWPLTAQERHAAESCSPRSAAAAGNRAAVREDDGAGAGAGRGVLAQGLQFAGPAAAGRAARGRAGPDGAALPDGRQGGRRSRGTAQTAAPDAARQCRAGGHGRPGASRRSSGRRMVATRLLEKAVFVRELLPQDLKLELEHLTVEEAMDVAEFLAHVVGQGPCPPDGRSRPGDVARGTAARHRSRIAGRAVLAVEQRGRAGRRPRGGLPPALPPMGAGRRGLGRARCRYCGVMRNPVDRFLRSFRPIASPA